jgi:hypothetical protein
MADFREMEQDYIANPVGRLSKVRTRLDSLAKQYGMQYVAILVSIALISSMNCSVILSLSIESPRLWIEIVSPPDADVYVA